MRASLDGAVVLITGASSGIGLEMARQLASRAKVLVLVARRADRLAVLEKELRSRNPQLVVSLKACDLADRQATDAMLAAVEAETGKVDVLINNAGLGDVGAFDGANWPKLEKLILVNVMALGYLTKRLVGPMVAAGKGAILNVSSILGFEFLPDMATYVGSKHFVTGFTESLRLDLAGTGVVVSQLCPGPVATEFDSMAGVSGVPVHQRVEDCVRWALRGFERGRALIVPGILMNLLVLIGAITPRFLKRLVYRPVARWLRKKTAARSLRGGQGGARAA